MNKDHPCCSNLGSPVIGIDEVGRGSLIGPVVTAAVLYHSAIPPGIRDSKKICENKRNAFDEQIRQNAYVTIGEASVDEIDKLGIYPATLLAMQRAGQALHRQIGANGGDLLFLIDGNAAPKLPARTITLINGDNLCPTIASASIVAKVYRDRLITTLAQHDQIYDWAKNKGYGVPKHLAALERFGASPYHQCSFAPVKRALEGIAKKGPPRP